MKLTAVALFSVLAPSDAVNFRSLVERVTTRVKGGSPTKAAAVVAKRGASEPGDRSLQTVENLNNCWGDEPAAAWHADYRLGWSEGECHLAIDCNSPPYASQVACCKAAYAGQVSGFCLSQLPSPPTTSPTDAGGLDVWYPDYATAWTEAGCINDRPLPSGRPTYSTLLACCKGAYGGQVSGACLAELPTPPTTSPTDSGGAGFWYPDYDTAWNIAGCKNDLPLPYPNVNDRPNYSTQLACCKGAYGGQMSGACLAELPTPPTTSPTGSGGAGFWYPDYDTAWNIAGCKNELPLPYPNVNDRPNYSTQIACCKGAYGGQMSGACLSELATPPTTSPTESGGLGIWYPDYGTAWTEAGCVNTRPKPSGRPEYSTQIACCKGAYGGQVSGACLSQLPSPPTASPIGAGGLDVYYPDYDRSWPQGICINDSPIPSGRPEYSSKEACCSGAYGNQNTDVCMCDADPCHSCKCSGAATNPACTLTCS